MFKDVVKYNKTKENHDDNFGVGVVNLGVGHRFILQEVRERAGLEITAEIIRRVGKNAARNPTVTTLLG